MSKPYHYFNLDHVASVFVYSILTFVSVTSALLFFVQSEYAPYSVP